MNYTRSKILEEWWEFGGGANDISIIPQSIKHNQIPGPTYRWHMETEKVHRQK